MANVYLQTWTFPEVGAHTISATTGGMLPRAGQQSIVGDDPPPIQSHNDPPPS